MAVSNPLAHGAVGDGVADDTDALLASIAALPSDGGIVYLPEGRTFQKRTKLTVSKPHVKFWAPNQQAEIFGSVTDGGGRQTIVCLNTQWCGFFGLKLRSNAGYRHSTLGDTQIAANGSTDIEVVGVEIDGAASAGIFLYGSRRHYIEGNYIHHTRADHIHHTRGAQASWVWDNYIFNEAPTLGDDGIACVTYSPSATRCGDMEWWNNTHLGGEHGRGFAIIGGNDIFIHDNWAIGTAGAGIIVASESSYNSSASRDIVARDNALYRVAHKGHHPGILVSGRNSSAGPLANLTFADNVVVDTINGQAYRVEGSYSNVVNTGLSTQASDFPGPVPTRADVRTRDTSVMKTRDTSFVPAAQRNGLYRVHVRPEPSGDGFQQRFEYVVQGGSSDVEAFVTAQVEAGAYLAEKRTVDGVAYALLLVASPVSVPTSLAGVSFRDLRAGDLDGSLSWLWERLNEGSY